VLNNEIGCGLQCPCGDNEVEDITDNALNQKILRLLRTNDASLSYLCLCEKVSQEEDGFYHPGSSEELGWLGHFTMNCTNENLKEFTLFEPDVFKKCSKQSVDRFFEDLGRCNHIETMQFSYADLTEIIYKLGPAMKNSNIIRLSMEECELGVPGKNHLFNVFRDMKSLEKLSIKWNDPGNDNFNDDVMAGCIPSLAACTAMRYLTLSCLGFGSNSCAALSANFPRMTSLQRLTLQRNSIDDSCVGVLVHGLAECKHLRILDLGCNMIGDDGLDVLVQGLPAGVVNLSLEWNEVTLARQLSMLRFEALNLEGNPLTFDGAQTIALTLANPECRLEFLAISGISFGDEGAAILAASLRINRRLTHMWFELSGITETGWDLFLPILCDTTSIDATYNSNHTLESLGAEKFPKDIRMLLGLNSDKDKSRVAATKILQAHRHLDMIPLFGRELGLLPYVVAWLERFAESRLDLKLTALYDFVRAMPLKVVNRVVDQTKGKKRKLNNSEVDMRN